MKFRQRNRDTSVQTSHRRRQPFQFLSPFLNRTKLYRPRIRDYGVTPPSDLPQRFFYHPEWHPRKLSSHTTDDTNRAPANHIPAASTFDLHEQLLPRRDVA